MIATKLVKTIGAGVTRDNFFDLCGGIGMNETLASDNENRMQEGL